MKSDIQINLIAQDLQTKDLNEKIDGLEHTSANQEQALDKVVLLGQRLLQELTKLGKDLPPNPQRHEKPAPSPEASESLCEVDFYHKITTNNTQYLNKTGLLDSEFDSLFSAEDLLRIEQELSSPICREKWDKWDFIATFSGGIAGVVADAFTDNLDANFSEWLGDFKIKSPQVSIDYQGPAFGGPNHRILSSGHDMLRVFSAIWRVLPASVLNRPLMPV